MTLLSVRRHPKAYLDGQKMLVGTQPGHRHVGYRCSNISGMAEPVVCDCATSSYNRGFGNVRGLRRRCGGLQRVDM